MNYALAVNKDKWLRHPAMGDPSFDTFEKTGDTVHRSEEPYEWTVNGSLYTDNRTDGRKYVYAGLYCWGYQGKPGCYSHFETYRQNDDGSWENLGWGLDKHYVFKDVGIPTSGCPDVVLFWDEKLKKYLLTYDWGTENNSWDTAFNLAGTTADSGAAVAWADTPAGPFTRFPEPVFRNTMLQGKYGRFLRFYATTVIPRKNDYLALILCDSASNFAWGLAAATGSSPDKLFDMPKMVLCADREDYYPAPMEYYPAFVVGDTVYAPATSVEANRNYQMIFAAKLEEAHLPEAWHMVADGSIWHSRPLDDEYYGIWGQTINGTVDNDGVFNVMYAARDKRGYGTISTAARRWDDPYSDGFTISGHTAPSISLLRDAYRTFDLTAEFKLSGGFADFLFGFDGELGANAPVSDAWPCDESLDSYTALRISGSEWKIVDHGEEKATGSADGEIISVGIRREDDKAVFTVNGTSVADYSIPSAGYLPVGVRTDKFTVLDCTKFDIEGSSVPAVFSYNDVDALLGGGVGDVNYKVENGIRTGSRRVKWNIYGSEMTIFGRKAPGLGKAKVRADGQDIGEIDFSSESEETGDLLSFTLPYGRHGIELIPDGDIIVPRLRAVQG